MNVCVIPFKATVFLNVIYFDSDMNSPGTCLVYQWSVQRGHSRTEGQKSLLPPRLRPTAQRPRAIQEVCVHFPVMEEEEELHWNSSSAAPGWGIPATAKGAGLTSGYSAT